MLYCALLKLTDQDFMPEGDLKFTFPFPETELQILFL